MSSNVNSQEELYKRLLKAFSVNALKYLFNIVESKDKHDTLLNVVVSANSVINIESVVFENFSLLKQHVYVYNFVGVLPTNYLSNHPYVRSVNKVTSNHTIYNILYPVTFEFYNKTKSAVESIDFLIPAQLHRKGTRFLLHINILERDIKSLTTDKIVNVSRDVNDDTIIDSFIQATIAHGIQLHRCDLNKGIKKLWEDDEIDAFKAKFKKSKSTSTEVLDEDYMIKKDMPIEYQEMLKTPIVQTGYRVLKNKKLVDAFIVDPTKGVFYFSIFPKQLQGTTDLIELVLSNN